ncbi:TnsA-like heteromeric transposase endonuclease subunit [Nocardia africana]|uniref:TnsA-like heteromeric transposase endonuclease subunit n=1 Tax=Nocardia africana TaxID=134964 RepID=UPI0007A4494D|nr:TnsA-like heteromeric transposase endonuclease subunit [Nocardia africana]MCC3318317.1 TnsA-like heteromeric transposase endonuclease subunit [Nocardia africana]
MAVRFRGDDGEFVDTTLRRLPIDEVLSGRPVREFRWWKGKRHYSGWYWSSTTGGHVVYESRLELARILLADQDRDVVAIAAQPFLLEGVDGDRVRKHVPDLLLARADGGLTVVDVKSPDRVSDSKVAAQFAWTRSVCEEHGLGFEVWSGCDPVLLGNVRFLAGYRRPVTIALELADAVMAAVSEPLELGVLERSLARSAPPLVIRPVILHLLWRSWLSADLSQTLSSSTVVSAIVNPVGVVA